MVQTPRLLIHSGDRVVALDEVRGIQTPEPLGTHYPLPHTQVLDLAIAGMEEQGLHVIRQEHALARGGQRYFGLMQLANGSNNADFGLVAAIRNAHDKSFAAGLTLGSHVFICSNLAFSGQIIFQRRHTRFAADDLPGLVNDALGQLGTLRRSQEMRIEGYKRTELSDDQAYATIVRAALSQIIPNARIKEVVEQWRRPIHQEFEARTGWSLFNDFTEVLKAYPVDQVSGRTRALHGLMDTTCHLDFSEDVVAEEESEQQQRRPGPFRSLLQRLHSGF